MPLTSHLENGGSPLRRFFALELPHTRRAMANSDPGHWAALHGVLIVPATGDGPYPSGTVGTAFDYLVRFMIRPTPANDLNARRGAENLARRRDCPRRVPDAWPDLAALLDRIAGNQPTATDLTRPCFALALYEQLWRTPYRDDWPLPALGPAASLSHVLDLCPSEAADDLIQLAHLLQQRAPELLTDPEAILNPTFAGSEAVGGADADLIANRTLVEIKTTRRAHAHWAADLRQLVSYLLLDWDDRYGIERVGLYYARQGLLLTWTIGELLDVLAGKPTNLDHLRARFREVCEQIAADHEATETPSRAHPHRPADA